MPVLWPIGVAFGCFVVVSATLLVFPGLVHKRRTRASFRVKHGSHRGGAGENHENTIHAFDHAKGLFVQWWLWGVSLERGGC